MSGELEQRLLALGTALDVAPAPDLVPAVLTGLPARRRRPHRPAGRVLAVAFAIVLLLAGAAMAVPTSRDAILRAIGLRGVSIERVPRLPPLPSGARTGARLALGRPIALARVRHAAGFAPLLPPRGQCLQPVSSSSAGIPHRTHPGSDSTTISSRHEEQKGQGPRPHPAHRIGKSTSSIRGTARPFILKVIDPNTSVKVTRVNGAQGVYLSGAPHQVLFGASTGQIRSDKVRLAGNVLIWQHGPLIVRIEGTRTLAQALAIARSLRG